MTQEEKSLLLQDLSARLSYGVMIKDTYSGHYGRLVEIGNTFAYFISALNSNTLDVQLYYIKPYLRPLSSITSQEWCEMCDCDTEDEKAAIYLKDGRRFVSPVNKETFLNSHHFDYRGLIKKGLALEAPEGMYKKEE